MTKDLVPWVTKTFATTGNEQNWLIGFSKSGLGAQDLILKHPDLFTEAASWDFPADMTQLQPIRVRAPSMRTVRTPTSRRTIA